MSLENVIERVQYHFETLVSRKLSETPEEQKLLQLFRNIEKQYADENHSDLSVTLVRSKRAFDLKRTWIGIRMGLIELSQPSVVNGRESYWKSRGVVVRRVNGVSRVMFTTNEGWTDLEWLSKYQIWLDARHDLYLKEGLAPEQIPPVSLEQKIQLALKFASFYVDFRYGTGVKSKKKIEIEDPQWQLFW